MKRFFTFTAGWFATVMILGVVTSANAMIANGGFETGDLTGWAYGGQAGVQADVVYDGTYAAWVGTVDYNQDDVNDFTNETGSEGYTNNWISQTVDVTGMTSLEFWYNFYTWDYESYDEPGFEIQINGTTLLNINAADIDTTGDGVSLDSTGWTLFAYDLTGYNEATLDLTIYAGNTGDSKYQSWVYIDNTAPVPVPSTMFLMGSGLIGLAGIGRSCLKKS